MRKNIIILAILIPVLCLLGLVIYNLPPVYDRLAWRVDALKADIKYAINPPEKIVFTPLPQHPATATPQIEIVPPNSSPTVELAFATATPTTPPTPIAPPTLSPTPLPGQVMLGGLRHEYQRWNNCGPANLSMALSYWGWQGDQRTTAPFLKPNERDKNVMPYEMEAYVEGQTDLLATVRVGGDANKLKAFISSGYPVLVEKGFEGVNFDGWMGHYQVVTGYNDTTGEFFVQDSYKGPGMAIPYDQFINDWRAFNYAYIVIYSPERREQVLEILGLDAYDNFNFHSADQKSSDEVAALTGRDLYFAWFNRGTNLVSLQDYTAAAAAYDTAFANYTMIPESERPWRMVWYQTGPYFAYYYTGRYQDLIALATTTLEAMSEPVLEESFYWRARGRGALGDVEGAIEDLQKCLEAHPEFGPCQDELRYLGIEP